MRYTFKFMLLIFFLFGCMDPVDTEDNVTIDAELADDLLNNAVDTLSIDERDYILEAFLWRDFMPGDISDHSLTSVNHLVALDSLPMPIYLDLNKQYVILNDSIWTSDYTDQRDNLYDYTLSRVSREGPEWPIHKNVSVVAEVKHTDVDSTYLIKVEYIRIVATF